MKSLRVSVLTAAAAALVSIAAPAIADSNQPRSVVVNFDELDLTTSQGATKLYARLRFAARQVCAPLEGRALRQRAAFNECYAEALTDAVEQVNIAAVTALHARSVQGERAS